MDWQLTINIIGFAALGAGGLLYVLSKNARLNTQETADLAHTRGERIVDLEAEIHRLSDRLSKVEGQMQALQALKAQEIAHEVARLLRGDVAVSPTEGN